MELTKEMKQVLFTFALVVAVGTVPATVASFGTSSFANDLDAMIEYTSLNLVGPVALFDQFNSELALAIGGLAQDTSYGAFRPSSANNTQIPATPSLVRPSIAPAGNIRPVPILAPAEMVKILVHEGIIPSEKAADALKILQKAIASRTTEKNERACFNFTRPLRIGDRGEDVQELHKVLKKEGLSVPDGDLYTEETSSAVSGYQELNPDILKDAGLKYGTGFMGKGTMTRLNRAHGCENYQLEKQDEPTYQSLEKLTPEQVQKKFELERLERERLYRSQDVKYDSAGRPIYPRPIQPGFQESGQPPTYSKPPYQPTTEPKPVLFPPTTEGSVVAPANSAILE